MNNKPARDAGYAWRRQFLLALMAAGLVLLIGRAVDLQVFNKKFLQRQGDLRHVDVVAVPAYRGKVLDRHGEHLAISSPVESVWINPQEFVAEESDLRALATLVALPLARVRKMADAATGKKFVYLRRRLDPGSTAKIKALGLSGVYFEREFRRYYPASEITAHLLGFTDIDDSGQEGIELAFDNVLAGTPGSKRVIRDGKKHIIENLENIRMPVPGQDLRLSIDERLQYLAYRELKAAVLEHRALSGSLVLLDSRTGEVLAMVNQPSFNPNTRSNLRGSLYRNRAITDLFEPGSTIKPFVVAAGLETGAFHPDSIVDTRPGFFRVGRNRVRDIHNYGVIDLTRVLQKSSNVGVTKIALSLKPEEMWRVYHGLGFGAPVGTAFPGEATGTLPDFQSWRPFKQATLSFGYGLSVSTLQLARAYAALANDGLMPSVTLLRRTEPDEHAVRVMSANNARMVRRMMETVVSREGTALRASVTGYRVAGKTGTVRKAGVGGYTSRRYIGLFAGMAPASDPRLVMVVVINEPGGKQYYGGLVAAPVFSKVMSGALRLLGIEPDQEESMPVVVAQTKEPT